MKYLLLFNIICFVLVSIYFLNPIDGVVLVLPLGIVQALSSFLILMNLNTSKRITMLCLIHLKLSGVGIVIPILFFNSYFFKIVFISCLCYYGMLAIYFLVIATLSHNELFKHK